MDEKLSNYGPTLCIKEICEIMQCGYSKGRLIMDQVKHFRSGKKDLCWTIDLINFIESNKGIVVKWPKKHL